MVFAVCVQGRTFAGECYGRDILTEKTCKGDGLDPEERKLLQLINQYRSRNGLPPIPSSPSLNLIANRHVRDVAENASSFDRGGQNWLHGWSNCPYDANDPDTFKCMWESPKRLNTSYHGIAFEDFCGSPEAQYKDFIMTADYAFKTWQSHGLHNDVILNKGPWKKFRWKAMGIGIYKGYASLWLGAETDPLVREEER